MFWNVAGVVKTFADSSAAETLDEVSLPENQFVTINGYSCSLAI